MTNPTITITAGDPCGIGPEVLAKSLALGSVQEVCTPVVIGSQIALDIGIEVAGVNLKTRHIDDIDNARAEAGIIDVLDSGELAKEDIVLGVASAACGAANAKWLSQAAQLAVSGQAPSTVMAPVNSESLALGKQDLSDVFGKDPASRYLTLLSGPLRIVHIFDHIYLEDVCRQLTQPIVTQAIERTCEALVNWGISEPRIGVAGLNPHAHGPQEDQAITPGVEAAQQNGIDVQGPIPPDTIFRHCIDGRYDVVIAMFHDQGHIAIKTWGFVGNCALFLGAPYLFLSVGHGTAYDIVGKGIANHEMILTAMFQAASLSAGNGFL